MPAWHGITWCDLMSWKYQGGREYRKEDSAEADRALVENPLTHRRTLRTGRKICFCERACIQELCCYWALVKTSCGRWPWCWCRYFLWFKNWNLLLETQWLAWLRLLLCIDANNLPRHRHWWHFFSSGRCCCSATVMGTAWPCFMTSFNGRRGA